MTDNPPECGVPLSNFRGRGDDDAAQRINGFVAGRDERLVER